MNGTEPPRLRIVFQEGPPFDEDEAADLVRVHLADDELAELHRAMEEGRADRVEELVGLALDRYVRADLVDQLRDAERDVMEPLARLWKTFKAFTTAVRAVMPAGATSKQVAAVVIWFAHGFARGDFDGPTPAGHVPRPSREGVRPQCDGRCRRATARDGPRGPQQGAPRSAPARRRPRVARPSAVNTDASALKTDSQGVREGGHGGPQTATRPASCHTPPAPYA